MLYSIDATLVAACESTLSCVTYGDRFREGLAQPGKDRVGAARAMGVSVQAVGAIVNGKTKSATAENNVAAAAYLGCSATWLASGKGQPNWGAATASNVDNAPDLKPLRRIPVVGEVKGGEHGYLEEHQYPVGQGDGYIDYPSGDPNAYALRVRGDSMHPRYRAGEFVVIEPSIEPQDGDDVVVTCRDGRKMLKQLNWRRDGELQLLSINNGYMPITLALEEVETVQLVAGRARKSALQRG